MKHYFKKIVFDSQTYKMAIIFTVLITVLLCADYKNLIVGFISKYEIVLSIIILFGIFIITVLFFIWNHYFDLFYKIPTPNSLDRVSCFCCIGAVLYYVAIKTINQVYNYKSIVLVSVFLISFLIIVFRSIRYHCLINKSVNLKSNVYDLKQLVDGLSEENDSSPILILERDVDYDLFGRNEIIVQLCLAIELCCKSDMPFVIGLSGEWGSGKTTILNIAKKNYEENSSIVIIDNFDPWIYASPKAMLAGMYYTILQQTGVKYNNTEVNELINTVFEIVDDSAKIKKIGKIAKSILAQSEGNDSVEALKNRIDEYLKAKDKSIVFFIDNLDRASAENVRFVFKLVGAVFDFARVKYVLSYDKSRLSEIFEDSLQIDSRYVEKIINQELIVPKISDDNRHYIYKKAIHSLLAFNGVSQGQIQDFDAIINFIVDEVHDIRKLKRLLNSAFFITFGKNNLYKPDLLAIEVIRFLDPALYESIYKNRGYFIDSDERFDSTALWGALRAEEFNEKCKEYFKVLFKDREPFIQLLSDVFPNVYRYSKEYDIKQSGNTDDDRYKDTQINSRINSAKFFDLYFSYSLNDFLSVGIKFNKGLSTVLSYPKDKIESEFTNLILDVPKTEQLEWAQKLYLCRKDIESSAAYPILISLYKNIELFDNERGFLSLSARERVFGVMSFLFSTTDKKNAFITFMNNDIRKLFVVTEMIYWLNDKDEDSKDLLMSYSKGICDNILKNSIDIYNDAFYVDGNIWSIYHTYIECNVDEPETKIKEYIAQIICTNNIYRILNETVGSSIGEGYGYRIVKESFEKLFDENNNIKELLNERLPINQTEQLIYDLYQDYLQYNGSIKCQRYFDSPFEFKL